MPSRSLHSLRILLADDDPGIREGLDAFLDKEGHRVFAASGGLEAVEIARRTTVDLSILDIHMPDLGGLEAFHRILQLKLFLPGVFISGEAGGEVEEAVLAVGGWALIAKPINLSEIRSVLVSVENWHRRQLRRGDSLFDERDLGRPDLPDQIP